MDWASGWSRVCWPVFEASRHAGSARAVGCWLMEAAVQASDPVDAAPAPGEAVIEVRGLWSVFPLPGGGQHVVHQDLDLTVRRGEVLTLVGGSGTGKTVLLRQMLGLNHPARGSVTVLGRPAHELAREGAATRVGMLFQQGALFSAFSVLDNIAFPLRETGALPEALVREAALLKLRMVGLKAGDAHKMPSELSGGMIKRVALARALIMDPPLLMLDEPTAGQRLAEPERPCRRHRQRELRLRGARRRPARLQPDQRAHGRQPPPVRGDAGLPEARGRAQAPERAAAPRMPDAVVGRQPDARLGLIGGR